MSNYARRDDNRIPNLLGESSAEDGTIVSVHADPTTHRLKTESYVSGGLGKMVTEEFDTVTATYPNTTTEVYTYTAGGDTVATITVTYTTTSKEFIDTVVRT